MELRVIYDPILRQKAHPVELFDSGLKAYADEMLKVMKAHNGLGLAANQVGLDKRLIVFGYEPKDKKDELPRIPFTALVNPVVVKASKEKETQAEGCLSLPGLELPAFNVLAASGLTVIAVITETAKPSGRGGQLKDPVMKAAAEAAGIAVFQPTDVAELTSILRQLQADLVVLASYGKILSAEALDAPLYGSLNIHPSLLPKYRGATPIPSALLNGDTETGVTIIRMSSRVDAGEIIAQVAEPIEPTDTTVTLREKLFDTGAKLLLRELPRYLAGQAECTPQNEDDVIKTYKLSKAMAEIDWTKPLETIDREIRAFQPWPGAHTFLEGKRLKILGSRYADGKLVFDRVQLEGKNPAAWEDFKRGYAEQLKKTDWYGKIS